jgi:hypothetical protein
MTAIACEVLIKNAAWMLKFTDGRNTADSAGGADPQGLGSLKPSQVIGRVLQPRLGGSWISKDPEQPVGAWRQHIGRMRSEVLHRGRRPSAVDADEAIIAMGKLEQHIADRLAARCTVYPRTAYVYVGPRGLDRRGHLDAVLRTLGDAFDTPEVWMDEYVAYLDVVLGEEADND